MRFRSGICLLSISLSTCCIWKDEPEPKSELEKLPAATHQGKNTFGCLVNGKAWFTETSIDARAFYQGGLLSIGSSVINKDRNQGMGFLIADSTLNESKYMLDDSLNSYATFGDATGTCNYLCYDGRGEVTITRLFKGIISGTFYFTVSRSNCDTTRISDGRFDLTYSR